MKSCSFVTVVSKETTIHREEGRAGWELWEILVGKYVRRRDQKKCGCEDDEDDDEDPQV